MSDNDWVKNLKVGDKVAIERSSTWNKNYYIISKVEKITPTGRIKLSNGSQYYPDGRKIGGRYCEPLREVTPQIVELIKRRELLNKLEFDKFKGLLSVDRLKLLLEWQEELLAKAKD